MAFDTVALVAALTFALWISPTPTGPREGLLALGFLVAARAIFSHCGLYRSRRLDSRGSVYLQMTKAVSLVTIVLALAPQASHWRFLFAFWISALMLLVLSRAALFRSLDALRRRGRNLRNIVIVGAGPRGRRFAAALESRIELGYRILGFLDHTGVETGGVELLGGLHRLPELLASHEIDEVAVALPIKSYYAEIRRIVSLCERHGILVRLPGDLFDSRWARIELEQFEDLRSLTLVTGHGSGMSLWIKRGIDLALSAVALVLLAPVMALIAVAVKLDSPGPAFYLQLRAGYHLRRFRIWKIRTMTTDAEQRQQALEERNEVEGAAFKIRDDPRITRLGRWLRRTSIDELPQLINVLKGEMSLVGPRPLPLRDVARLSEDWHRRRFSVRPGLTCLWQSGGRHRVGFEEWMRLDMDYIDNWSLLLDLKILLRTVPAVLSGTGAS